jgi:hypothetical protein
MTYHTEHLRLAPVLAKARELDIATNPAPEALYEAGNSGFAIWCTPQDHPAGDKWDQVKMDTGAFAKPCSFLASVAWDWTGEKITSLRVSTFAYDLNKVDRAAKVHNRPEDIFWAKKKIRWLFKQAGVGCPPIRLPRRPDETE